MISRAAGISSCDIPLCHACQIAKPKRRSSGAKTTKDLPERQDVLSVDQLEPGDRCSSIDQYESSVRGRLPSTQGKELDALKYCGGTLFIDHASSRVFTYHQVSLSATDTIISKRKMELDARSCGVELKSFQTDNGIFKSREFEQDLYNNEQRTDRCAVGAHHQNGKAKRNIQTVQNMARSMLLHAALQWESIYDPELWPYAMTHAVFIFNHLPQQDLGWLSPMEVFCKTVCSYLRRLRVWGCPAFVLSPKLKTERKSLNWNLKPMAAKISVSPKTTPPQ